MQSLKNTHLEINTMWFHSYVEYRQLLNKQKTNEQKNQYVDTGEKIVITTREGEAGRGWAKWIQGLR